MSKEIAQRIRNVQAVIDKLQICQYDPSNANILTQQYGLMKFDENEVDSTTRLSEYIRLRLNTDAETIVQFMKDGWRLPTPDLIISVTGGAKSFEMSARLRKVFQRGLVAAAITTNAWIITAGTNAGVVREVGQALNNYRYKNQKHGFDVPCIGIASWGYTAGKEQLDNQPDPISINGSPSKGMRSFGRSNQSPAVHAVRMEIADQYCVRNYIVKEKLKKCCDLEPNHSHFLLLDDGQASASNVIDLRADIEKCSRRITIESQTTEPLETLIPIIMVLVEGGPSSVETICVALKSNTPVVVVKDSGRAADVVAELHACYTGNENSNSAHPSRPQTSHGKTGSRDNEFDAILQKSRTDNPWVSEVKKESWDILKSHIQLVTIFKFDSKQHHGNLEDVILDALFNAAKDFGDQNEQHRRIAQLKLAIAWNKINYAKKNLLTDTSISKWKEDDLRYALVDALRRGHREFVELLIEFGTSLEKLTYRDLDFLYKTTFTGDRLIVKGRRKHNELTKDDFYSDYLRSIVIHQNKKGKPNYDDNLGQNAARDLFFWSIFLNRFELAVYFCSKNWNSSVAPLFGAQIYRRAARLTHDIDKKHEYEECANQFDIHATLIIDRCFDNDENFAVDLLKRPAAAFGDEYPLILAKKANCRSFLASKCVQKYLDNKWFGDIDYKRKAINVRIFLCTLFIPLIPIFCFLLPYFQKHKKITRSARERIKFSQPLMIHNTVEPDPVKGIDRVRWTDKIRYFYKAPIVRFYYYMIFFVIFLALFSFVLLVDYFPLNTFGERRSGVLNLQIPITEIILHVCLWSLIVEEIRQFIFTSSKREYISEVWNIIDIIAIVFYLIGFITRFFVTETLFTVSKIFLCLDLILWYVRTLNLFAAYERLGPKLIMIFNTMRDLLFFVCFIFIFLLGFSITSWSLITTKNQVNWTYYDNGTLDNVTVTGGGSGLWSWQILRDVINYGVWKVFGQVDPIDGTDAYSAIAFILAILFLAIANVLLLNVLVALFNVTIQNVENQSHRIWRYQRFVIVFEYCDKPPLPPPFNSVYYLFSSIRYLIKNVCCSRKKQSSVANEMLVMDRIDSNGNHISEEFKITDAMQRESAIADDYWNETLTEGGKKDFVDVQLQNIQRELRDVKERLQNTPVFDF